jgi:peroxiredoxin
MTIKVGDALPNVTLRTMAEGGLAAVETGAIFAGKKAVLFGVPGAFTPTCSNNHLPGYLENATAIRARGVDLIAVVSVNDVHVMAAWAAANHNEGRVLFLADGSGDLARATGLGVDIPGMGYRYKRFSMLLDNGVVQSLHVETERGVNVSGAARMLELL